jgi:hypothetical protein
MTAAFMRDLISLHRPGLPWPNLTISIMAQLR